MGFFGSCGRGRMVFPKKKISTDNYGYYPVSDTGASSSSGVPVPPLNGQETVVVPNMTMQLVTVVPSVVKWNNPLNLRVSGNEWQGKLSDKQRTQQAFEEFESLDYGTRAAIKNLLTYFSRGLDTIRKIISTWAPSSENNTTAYIQYVSNSMIINPDVVINLKDKKVMASLVSAMSYVEKGKDQALPVFYVMGVIDKFNLI